MTDLNSLARETGSVGGGNLRYPTLLSEREFLTVLNQPEHPFSKQFEQLVQLEAIRKLVDIC